jgi:hypothetical protein
MGKFLNINIKAIGGVAIALLAVSTAAFGQQSQRAVDAPQPIEIASAMPEGSAVSAESFHAAPATGVALAAPMPIIAVTPERSKPVTHRFWDRENTALFMANGAVATTDFFVTRANLATGGRELNPVARVFTSSTPALASNFALETAGVIGISYMFHKTGHHKLERLTSLMNLSASGGAVMYDLTHR